MKKLKVLLLAICFFVPFMLTGCKDEIITLQTPQNVRVENGVIVFNAVEGAQYYTISIGELTFDVYTNNENVEVVDGLVKYNANKILSVTETYSIKVMACSSEEGKESGEFSKAIEYKHVKKLDGPANTKINGTVLTWDNVNNANKYTIKIVTPANSTLYDSNGNALPSDDLASIAKAQLTEFSVNSNAFEFTSLLTAAGKYSFYVCAEYVDNQTSVRSDFVRAGNYEHLVQLKTPQVVSVDEYENELHLTAVIDDNANQITINSGKYSNTVSLSNSAISKNGNIVDINLNKIFKDVKVDGVALDLTNAAQYDFSVKISKQVSGSTKYYQDSYISEIINYTKKVNLIAPNNVGLTYSEQDNTFIASWRAPATQEEYIVGYKLVVATSTGIEEYIVSSSVLSCQIGSDVVAVAVKSLGGANYNNSKLSTFVANPNYTSQLSALTIGSTGNMLSWNNVADYYIVEVGNNYKSIIQNNYTIDVANIDEVSFETKVVAIKQGYKFSEKTKNITQSETLNTPTFADDGSAVNGYVVNFEGDENALGYNVYMTSKGGSTIKINHLFTSTSIDLLPYMVAEGNYASYSVRIQAVAAKYSKYKNSSISDAVTIEYSEPIEKPEFYEINGVATPIVKISSEQGVKYYLYFYGVEEAASYEILINGNMKLVDIINEGYQGLYKVDITEYFTTANNYSIKVKAIPTEESALRQGDYNVCQYEYIAQLNEVANINVAEFRGTYTLTFDSVEHATEYKVRIVKFNDEEYSKYLESMSLANPFIVTGSTDITSYIVDGGEYYVYVTAINSENSNYIDSAETKNPAIVNKLSSLKTPSNLLTNNISKDRYTVNWKGDDNADYYTVKIIDPNNVRNTFNVYGTRTANISAYLTIPGNYTVSVAAMVDPNGDKASSHVSSAFSSINLYYVYTQKFDFERYSVSISNTEYDFVVERIDDLKNLVWYHLIYDIDEDDKLSMYLHQETKQNGTKESLSEVMIRLADESTTLNLYNFEEDDTWLELETSGTESEMFAYLCEKMALIYPDLCILQDYDETDAVEYVRVTHEDASPIFKVLYKNVLNEEKTKMPIRLVSIGTQYSNGFEYLPVSARRSTSSVFDIDNCEGMPVTTTEQLLLAVMNGKKPVFYGDCQTAETVYANAKHVLTKIVSNKMTDVEKVEAIFDWIEYAYTLNYGNYSLVENKESLDIFYLEGALLNINNSNNGGFDGEFYLGTKVASNATYAKVFTLLCGIEGIETVIVNGSYENEQGTQLDHKWNKVKLKTPNDVQAVWYAVDVTFSDNQIENKLDVASHAYFLVTDAYLSSQLGLVENSSNMSKEVAGDYVTEHACITNYNYYANTSFALQRSEFVNVGKNFGIYDSFEYAKTYISTTSYQAYTPTSSYDQLNNYILNMIFHAENSKQVSGKKGGVIEFQINKNNNSGSITFDKAKIETVLADAVSKYSVSSTRVTQVYSNYTNATGFITLVFVIE